MASSCYRTIAVVVVLFAMPQESNARYVKNSEGRIRDYILNHDNYSVADRPVQNSEDWVDVSMSLNIHVMLDISERDQVITVVSWVQMTWRDHRLQWNSKEFGDVEFINMHNNDIWTPKVFLSNGVNNDALSVVSAERGSVIVTSDGVASLGTPLILSAQCPMFIKYFPFDTQTCMFEFVSENYIEERLRLFTSYSGDEAFLGSREWHLLNSTYTRHSRTFHNFAPSIPVANVSFAVFCLNIQRNPSHYIRTIWIPSCLLCLMSFVTFVAPPDSGERISLGVSMVLGLTVFQLLIADILPAASVDAPILSSYLTVNFCMACLAVPMSLMNINIAYGDSRVFFLKFQFLREVLLEHLPRVVGIPSYSQRIMNPNQDKVLFRKKNQVDMVEGGETVENKQNSTLKPLPSVQDKICTAERTKIELRTMALVMDRFYVVTFLTAFIAFFIYTIVDLGQNPGISDSAREYCGSSTV